MGAVLANPNDHLSISEINSSSNCVAERIAEGNLCESRKPSWKGQELYFAITQSKWQAHIAKQDELSSTTLEKPDL